MMCCSDKELFDKIFLLGCHRSHPPATTALLAVGIGVETVSYTHLDVYKRQSINGSLDEFTDADQVSAYAITPMEWAVGTKLILGEDNLLEPQRITTRAQAAAIFHRFIENIAQ